MQWLLEFFFFFNKKELFSREFPNSGLFSGGHDDSFGFAVMQRESNQWGKMWKFKFPPSKFFLFVFALSLLSFQDVHTGWAVLLCAIVKLLWNLFDISEHEFSLGGTHIGLLVYGYLHRFLLIQILNHNLWKIDWVILLADRQILLLVLGFLPLNAFVSLGLSLDIDDLVVETFLHKGILRVALLLWVCLRWANEIKV